MSVYTRRLRLLFVLLFCACALAACGERGPFAPDGSGATYKWTPSPPSPTPTRAPLTGAVTAGALTPAPGTAYLGIYADPSGLQGGASTDALVSVESQIGRHFAIDSHYLGFGQDLATKPVFDDYNNYRIPMMSITCQVADKGIANGKYDGTLTQLAFEAKTYGAPMMVRYMFDPNLPAGVVQPSSCWDQSSDSPGHVFDPTHFIDAWKHIHDIFVSQGATNVVWIWSVSGSPLASNPLAYYPGDNYVDWVSMDVYDTTGVGFAGTFSSLYSRLEPLSKPIMISETGAGQDQPAFFGAAVANMQQLFPSIRAFVYYDSISFPSGQNADFRITPSGLTPFITFAHDPYMAANGW